MKIEVKDHVQILEYAGDGLRHPAVDDNIRVAQIKGVRVEVQLSKEESKDLYLVQAAKEFSRFYPGAKAEAFSAEKVEKQIKSRAEEIRWIDGWKQFDGQKFTSDYGDEYEIRIWTGKPWICDGWGNPIKAIPHDVAPGDFEKLKRVLTEGLDPEAYL